MYSVEHIKLCEWMIPHGSAAVWNGDLNVTTRPAENLRFVFIGNIEITDSYWAAFLLPQYFGGNAQWNMVPLLNIASQGKLVQQSVVSRIEIHKSQGARIPAFSWWLWGRRHDGSSFTRGPPTLAREGASHYLSHVESFERNERMRRTLFWGGSGGSGGRGRFKRSNGVNGR